MPKDWTGSAMPSIVKGFAIIGQPFTKEQFKDAFGVDMPDVTFTEEEKRYQQRRNGVQDQPETEPFVQTQEQTVPSPIPVQTAKPAGSFGQRVLQHIEAANPQWAQTEQNEKPVNIEINGVGNSQPEELPQNRTKTKDVVKTIDDPYASEALSILRERNRTRNARTPETGTPSASTLHTISETTPARTGPETGRSVMNYLHQTGEYENADNIAAQPDRTTVRAMPPSLNTRPTQNWPKRRPNPSKPTSTEKKNTRSLATHSKTNTSPNPGKWAWPSSPSSTMP